MTYTGKITKNLSLLAFFVIMIIACKKVSIPVVTTTPVNLILQGSAYSGGKVTSDGGAQITSRGVCWDISIDPTIASNKTSDSTGSGLFTSYISGLTASTTYYVRAYATNSEGTAYGENLEFTTSQVDIPTVNTLGFKSVTMTTAAGGGDISNDGGLTVTARGVCWSTQGVPTVTDSHSSDGSGSGLFSSILTDLTLNTTYHIRAYATNSLGTAYGSDVQFTQIEPITDNDGNIYSIVTIGTQVWLGDNLKTTTFNDGSSIPYVSTGNDWSLTTTPAFCWYNNNELNNKATYGGLYNWYAVNTGKLCPTGWHVPSVDEYTTLVNYLGGTVIAGGNLKEAGPAHWAAPNLGATNGSGFTALPGGGRYDIYSEGGAFADIGYYGYFWSATVGTNTSNAYSYNLYYNLNLVTKDEFSKKDGGSVRCIKNSQ